VLSASLFPVYFHHSSFCTAAAEHKTFTEKKEKEFNDAIIVEVRNIRSEIILKLYLVTI
jgi:hypothetical protein